MIQCNQKLAVIRLTLLQGICQPGIGSEGRRMAQQNVLFKNSDQCKDWEGKKRAPEVTVVAMLKKGQ